MVFPGPCLICLEQYEEAVGAFDLALGLDSTLAPPVWYQKGRALAELQCYEDAVRAYGRSLECDPDSTASWVNLGIALSHLGRYEEAIDACELSLALAPDDAAAWSAKGDALMGLKRYQEALESYNQVLAIEPEHGHAVQQRACPE